jgi:hypothetical protein
MQPSDNKRARRIGVAGALRSGAKADLAGEARITVGRADSRRLMVGLNVFEPVLFAQLHNDGVGIARYRENVIDAFSRNSGGERFKYFQSRWRR